MSTYWLPCKPILFELSKGLVGEIRETREEGTASGNACLTDGENYVWAQRSANGNTQFACYAGNDPDKILNHLARKFRVAFVSEYDPGWDELAADYDYVKFSFD